MKFAIGDRVAYAIYSSRQCKGARGTISDENTDSFGVVVYRINWDLNWDSFPVPNYVWGTELSLVPPLEQLAEASE